MPKTILIIEDDKDILDMMSFILSDEGYVIVASTDGKPLKDLKDINPAMIMLDNRLTDGYGKNYCKEIKSNPDTAHFTVILFSANPNLEKMARDSGADGYLTKPFNIDDLIELAKRFVNDK